MLKLLIAFVLILCNAGFALSELAVVSASRARLQALAEQGRRGARSALALAEHPGRFLSTVQIGITLVGIVAGAVSGAALGKDLGLILQEMGLSRLSADAAGYGIVIGLITYFSVVIGELVPKHIALANPEAIACAIAPTMTWLSRLAAPAVWLLDSSTRLVIRLLGRSPKQGEEITDEEIRLVMGEAARAGVIRHDERDMIAAVMRFADRTVRSVMTHRTNVSYLDANAPESEKLALLARTAHSCVPVADGGPENILGVIRVRELLPALAAGRKVRVEEFVRSAPAVPDTIAALDALSVLRKSRVPIALVHDEYGDFEGVITPADILDALAGAFRSDTVAREAEARQLPDGSWRIAGAMPADELADRIGLDLPHPREYETAAGMLLAAFARLPEEGESIDLQDWRFTVLKMEDRRIEEISAVRTQ